jgi:hypothetical protein
MAGLDLFNIVIAWLDPAIHVDPQHALHFIMDARVEPGHDDN